MNREEERKQGYVFKQYRRKEIAELRPVTHVECIEFRRATRYKGLFLKPILIADGVEVYIPSEDRKNGSPKLGDMIARNPKNHNDQWLVAKQYFEDNFELIENPKP